MNRLIRNGLNLIFLLNSINGWSISIQGENGNQRDRLRVAAERRSVSDLGDVTIRESRSKHSVPHTGNTPKNGVGIVPSSLEPLCWSGTGARGY